MSNTIQRERKVYIDLIKIIACFFVIADHTNYFFGAGRDLLCNAGKIDELFLFIYATIFHVAVTLFVMSSGALLIGKKDESYKKCLIRVLKCIAVIIIFTLPYYLKDKNPESVSVLSYIKVLIKGDYVMSFWYMYMYLALLIMLPIIRRMVTNFKISDYRYFFLFIIICSFDFITGLNKYYQMPLFANYVGIFVMGYFLDNFEVKEILFGKAKKLNVTLEFVVTTILLILDVILVSLYSLFETRRDNTISNRFYCWDNIFYIYMSFYIFYWIKKLLEKQAAKNNNLFGRVYIRYIFDSTTCYLLYI